MQGIFGIVQPLLAFQDRMMCRRPSVRQRVFFFFFFFFFFFCGSNARIVIKFGTGSAIKHLRADSVVVPIRPI